MIFCIYEGSTLIATTKDQDAKIAWQSARTYVRGMAYADGVQGPERIEQSHGPQSRVRVSRGIYSASPMSVDPKGRLTP